MKLRFTNTGKLYGFLAFAKKQPQDATIDMNDGFNCALGQFLRQNGHDHVLVSIGYVRVNGAQYDLPEQFEHRLYGGSPIAHNYGVFNIPTTWADIVARMEA